MKDNFSSALKLTGLCVVLFAGAYTAAIWSIAALAAPNKGNGEVLMKEGRIVGFTRIGQSFTKDNYFWSRPSAVNYNAAGSAGSNKGPTNPEYLSLVQARIDTFLRHNPAVQRQDIPAEMVTASGSGLDPHISPIAATVQIARIARARGISEESIRQIVSRTIENPLFGLFGPSQLNVLKLNLALDGIK